MFYIILSVHCEPNSYFLCYYKNYKIFFQALSCVLKVFQLHYTFFPVYGLLGAIIFTFRGKAEVHLQLLKAFCFFKITWTSIFKLFSFQIVTFSLVIITHWCALARSLRRCQGSISYKSLLHFLLCRSSVAHFARDILDPNCVLFITLPFPSPTLPHWPPPPPFFFYFLFAYLFSSPGLKVVLVISYLYSRP